jgi:hypothetical protein
MSAIRPEKTVSIQRESLIGGNTCDEKHHLDCSQSATYLAI